MPIVLRSNGINNYVNLGSTLTVSTNSSVKFKFSNGNNDAFSDNANRIFGLNNGNRTMYGKVGTVNRFRVRAFNVNTDFDWDDGSHSFIDAHEYEILQDGVDSFLYVDGDLKVTNSGDVRQVRIANLLGNVGGVYSSLDLYSLFIGDTDTPANNRQFNADSSGGTGNVLPNDIGTDATLAGFPTDDSQWISVGGGDEITVTGETAAFYFYAIDGIVDLTPEITVTGETASFNFTAISGAVLLESEIIVTGETANFDFTAIGGTIELEGEIIITGETALFDFSAIDGVVIGSLWKNRQPLPTDWAGKAVVYTEWGIKQTSSTTWTDK